MCLRSWHLSFTHSSNQHGAQANRADLALLQDAEGKMERQGTFVPASATASIPDTVSSTSATSSAMPVACHCHGIVDIHFKLCTITNVQRLMAGNLQCSCCPVGQQHTTEPLLIGLLFCTFSFCWCIAILCASCSGGAPGCVAGSPQLLQRPGRSHCIGRHSCGGGRHHGSSCVLCRKRRRPQ